MNTKTIKQKEKILTDGIEAVVKKQKIGLWRTHPSFFYLVLYLAADATIASASFFSKTTNVASYANLFEVVPQPIYAAMFGLVALLFSIALVSKTNRMIRIAASLNMIPLSMMVMNFILLVPVTGQIGLLVAASKWGLGFALSFLMVREPFVNPISARAK